MISYNKLWETMKEQQATTYTLQTNNISSSTIRRLKENQSVSTNTIDLLCKILDCKVEEIITYIPDHEKHVSSEVPSNTFMKPT